MTKKSLRTMTFVPGYMRKFLEKAKSFKSDALILDLEDSVPLEYKDQARKNIKEFLSQKSYQQQIYIRVNSIDSGLLSDDLEAVLLENTDGIMFTKIIDERDIYYFDRLLTQLELDRSFRPNKFKICPLIETGSALLSAYQIAKASPRVVALAFGGEDYLTDLDGLHKEHGVSLLVPRSMIVMAARSAKIEAIDTPYLNIQNVDGFKQEAGLARELGFSGSLIIHPSQIEIANGIFTPSKEEVKEARIVINTINESKRKGLGVALLDGKLIGPPMEKRALKILSKMKQIENAEKALGSNE